MSGDVSPSEEETRWPQFRAFPFAGADLSLLQNAWDFSRRKLSELRETIQSAAAAEHVACVAVSGSLCRMEAHERSDQDLLIVVDDRHTQMGTDDLRQVHADIWNCIESAQLSVSARRPKPGGIFSEAVSWKQLTDQSRRGVVDEAISTFGQRIQLLLDAQPVVEASCFEELQRDLLHWYSETCVAEWFKEASPFHWLWQDVQRYWRSLRSRSSWLYADDSAQSFEINLKLRSSRLVLVAAFLNALAEVSEPRDPQRSKVGTLCSLLKKTPLERLHQSTGSNAKNLLTDYEYLWSRCRDAGTVTGGPTNRDRSILKSLVNTLAENLPQGNSDWVF